MLIIHVPRVRNFMPTNTARFDLSNITISRIRQSQVEEITSVQKHRSEFVFWVHGPKRRPKTDRANKDTNNREDSSSSTTSHHHIANMAPSKPSVAPYSKDERVLCFHHEMLYEAKILEVQPVDDGGFNYRIHYKGWKNTWDDWVPQDRVRKFNDENRELAAQLSQAARESAQKSSKPVKKAGPKNGSDFSSARGSEERTGGAATLSGRGPRRARDFDLEPVSVLVPFPTVVFFVCACLAGGGGQVSLRGNLSLENF